MNPAHAKPTSAPKPAHLGAPQACAAAGGDTAAAAAQPAPPDPYRGHGGLYTIQGGRRVRVPAATPATAPKEPQ